MSEESKKYYKEHSENYKIAHQKYLKKNKICEIKVRTSEDDKKIIQAHAEKMGESVNAFMLRAIQQTIKSDNRKAKK